MRVKVRARIRQDRVIEAVVSLDREKLDDDSLSDVVEAVMTAGDGVEVSCEFVDLLHVEVVDLERVEVSVTAPQYEPEF